MTTKNLTAEESKMLRTLQAHGKTQPGVPYHADGEELGVIRDLRKKGLVMYTEPSHPHERYGYTLTGAGIVAVDALTAIRHPEGQAGEFQREDRYIVIKRKDLESTPTLMTHAFLFALDSLLGSLPKRECLVIESDWPEYEPTWAAIQARMAGQGAQDKQPECFCVEHGLHIETLQQRLAEAEALLTQVTENEQDGIPHATIGEFLAGQAQTERREPEEFCEGQWWLEELDAMVKGGTPNQKRAVAVVRNMMGQLADARAEAALATQPTTFDGKTVADRLDQMADVQPSGSTAQSDLYAAATVWRKHLAPPAAAHGDEAVRKIGPEDGLEEWSEGKFRLGRFTGRLYGNTDWALTRLVWSAALAFERSQSAIRAQAGEGEK